LFVLATYSDGKNPLVAASKACWPDALHQRCQMRFFNTLAADVLDYDDELNKKMYQDWDGLS
jgi:hypothetical protein